MNEGTVEEWVQKAEVDFNYALVGLRQKKLELFDGVCYHTQQCAEKYLKAFLTRHKVEFERIHKLNELNRGCMEADPTFKLIEDLLDVLEPYAVAVRYPGMQTDKEDAKEAVKTMKTIRAFVRMRLGLPK